MSSLLEGLLAEFEQPETIEYVSPQGVKLKFRPFKSHGDYAQFMRRAVKWAQTIQGAKCPAQFKELRTGFVEDAVAAYTLAELSVEPKLSHTDGFQIARNADLCQEIMTKLDEHRLRRVAAKFAEDVEEGKDGSSETSSTESDSPSAETSSENIPTS